MGTIKFRKEVSALPAELSTNTLYMVRVGTGFDLYVSDSTGSVAHKINSSNSLDIIEAASPETGTTHTFDLSLGGSQAVTFPAGGTVTLAFSNYPANKKAGFIIEAVNGGNCNIIYPTGSRFVNKALVGLTVSGTDVMLVVLDNGVPTFYINKNVGVV
ncbi:MAG: hypothetical protein PHI79_03430 [Sulfurovaceae bacterium]|nr:hypothetical protein [Sulfurovaceae bacterium]MDD5548633.1 hypothetical protein [Sulfurovaceae bacterium]